MTHIDLRVHNDATYSDADMNNIYWPHFKSLLEAANDKEKKKLLMDISPAVLVKAPQEVKDLHSKLVTGKEKANRKSEPVLIIRETRTRAKKEDETEK